MKGNNFCDFLFASQDNRVFFFKGGQLLKVKFAPRGANFFIKSWPPLKKADTNCHSTESAPIHIQHVLGRGTVILYKLSVTAVQ